MHQCVQVMPSTRSSPESAYANDSRELIVPAGLVEPPTRTSEYPEAGPFCGPSRGMLQAPFSWDVPTPITGDGASTSELMAIEMARLVAAAVNDGADLCDLQLRFQGRIQGGR